MPRITPPTAAISADPYAAQRQMFDEEMQKLMNHFNMFGPMG